MRHRNIEISRVPSLRLGLRTELFKNVQIDGTAGRANGESMLSVGLKF